MHCKSQSAVKSQTLQRKIMTIAYISDFTVAVAVSNYLLYIKSADILFYRTKGTNAPQKNVPVFFITLLQNTERKMNSSTLVLDSHVSMQGNILPELAELPPPQMNHCSLPSLLSDLSRPHSTLRRETPASPVIPYFFKKYPKNGIFAFSRPVQAWFLQIVRGWGFLMGHVLYNLCVIAKSVIIATDREIHCTL